MRQRKLEKLGRVNAVEESLGEHANEATSWLLQQQTQFASKWTEGEDLSEYFQAFSISVLHFCGVKSSHRISCTVFHLSEVFRCRIMVSIGAFVFCYSAANLKLCRYLALMKKIKRWILYGFYLLPKFFLYCLY